MTHPKTPAPRRAGVPAAALAALLLAGCAATHVGDEWQCPLPKGGSCGSVAEADPAVPDPAAGENTVLREPLWRPHAERAPGAPPGAGRSCEAECGGFDPLAWLARLFGDGNDGGGERATAGEPEPARAAAERDAPAARTARETDTAASSAHPEGPDAARLEEPAAAALPADPGRVRSESAQEDPDADDLRTEEVVARIWIAPFVDADGVYREAAWVRVVLEPAGWRVE